MRPWSISPRGTFEEHLFESTLLVGNPLGDPATRPLWVYLPPGYHADASRRYPSIYLIQGLTGQLDMWRNRAPMRPTVPELVDELFATPGVSPCVVVWVDCWTSLGGSQFVDSPATGRYHSYLCDEIVPWIDDRYRTKPSRDHRGIAGKSSGGYGAMITPMLRPDLWGALATHAGDALFETCFQPAFPRSVRVLRDLYGGSFTRFRQDFLSRPAFSRDGDDLLLNDWCMAACYSADADGMVRIPYDLDTATIIPPIWERWLALDPIRMVPRHAEALRSLRGIYIDAGTRDQHFLDLGAEAFRRALAEIGVTDIFFELFDATHVAIEYRYSISLRYLAERLTP
jgi:putative esterase